MSITRLLALAATGCFALGLVLAAIVVYLVPFADDALTYGAEAWGTTRHHWLAYYRTPNGPYVLIALPIIMLIAGGLAFGG